MKNDDNKKLDIHGFTEIIQKYEKLIFSICFRIIGNEEAAKDFTQETFLKAWYSRDTIDTVKNVKSWICRIAVNTCFSELRKKNKTVELKEDMAQSNTKDHPDVIIENNELSEHIQDALNQLKPDYKIVIVLKYLLNQKYDEIEQTLGITKSTLESRLFRARNKFKSILKQKKYGLGVI